MTIYAVIDTNVIISSILTANPLSPTIGIIESIEEKKLIPLYSNYLLSEYREVLSRTKFHVPDIIRDNMLLLFTQYGLNVEPTTIYQDLPDPDDAPIFMITMDTRGMESFLVTGNIKHFPPLEYVVTPRRMMEILYETDRQ